MVGYTLLNRLHTLNSLDSTSHFYMGPSFTKRFVLVSVKPFRETSLKISLFILSLLSLSSLAQAQSENILKPFLKECETSEVKNIVGETGSCRIIVVPKGKFAPKKGVCIGTFMGVLPCVVNYYAAYGSGAVGLTCGTDPMDLSIDEAFQAETANFNVATIINGATGQDLILDNKFNYTSLSSRKLNVLLAESSQDVQAKVEINLGSSIVELSEVTCQKND